MFITGQLKPALFRNKADKYFIVYDKKDALVFNGIYVTRVKIFFIVHAQNLYEIRAIDRIDRSLVRFIMAGLGTPVSFNNLKQLKQYAHHTIKFVKMPPASNDFMKSELFQFVNGCQFQ